SSSRPRPAGSSQTSPAATTSAAAATGRSTRPTPRCRCWRSGSARRRRRSPGSRARFSTTSGCRSRARVPPGADWIDRQLRARGIDDERVLTAMARVPRERFVPKRLRTYAYADEALPIGGGQTVSQPFVVAYICQGLALEGAERVLDVGTGSGY